MGIEMNPSSLPARPRRARGFTLIELLTVITVIAILAAVLVPTIGAVQQHAAKVNTLMLFSKITDAFDAYKLQNGHFPLSPTEMSLSPPDNLGNVQFLLNVGSNFLRRILTADIGPQSYKPADAIFNPKSTVYLTLPDGLLSSTANNSSPTNEAIVDGFGNDQIGMVINLSQNATIPQSFGFDSVLCSADGGSAHPVNSSHALPLQIAIYSCTNSNTPTFMTNWDYTLYQ
jgi:prepilin-type N-terminal cleavage/methylation domain-containing protein